MLLSARQNKLVVLLHLMMISKEGIRLLHIVPNKDVFLFQRSFSIVWVLSSLLNHTVISH